MACMRRRPSLSPALSSFLISFFFFFRNFFATRPGRISSFLLARVHSVAQRKAGFHLKVMGTIPNGYRLMARQNTELQEVFAVTTLSRVELERALNDVLRPDLYHARPADPLNPNNPAKAAAK